MGGNSTACAERDSNSCTQDGTESLSVFPDCIPGLRIDYGVREEGQGKEATAKCTSENCQCLEDKTLRKAKCQEHFL